MIEYTTWRPEAPRIANNGEIERKYRGAPRTRDPVENSEKKSKKGIDKGCNLRYNGGIAN